MLITLHLEKLQFFAQHGLYEEEKKLGNEFELNIWLSFHTTQTVITDLDETINYAEVYELAKAAMLQPRELLETFLSDLAEKLKTRFPQLVKIKMSLYKLQMPLANFQGKIGVEIEKEY
ncbi:dihydroneopterin aldolase [Niabella insulamsoli]|uniref:dihydroneopterin aldolase n=1 Tax=Niabella insulamsoli TaxID=3144874 RepID=UPI0031FBEF5A